MKTPWDPHLLEHESQGEGGHGRSHSSLLEIHGSSKEFLFFFFFFGKFKFKFEPKKEREKKKKIKKIKKRERNQATWTSHMWDPPAVHALPCWPLQKFKFKHLFKDYPCLEDSMVGNFQEATMTPKLESSLAPTNYTWKTF